MQNYLTLVLHGVKNCHMPINLRAITIWNRKFNGNRTPYVWVFLFLPLWTLTGVDNFTWSRLCQLKTSANLKSFYLWSTFCMLSDFHFLFFFFRASLVGLKIAWNSSGFCGDFGPASPLSSVVACRPPHLHQIICSVHIIGSLFRLELLAVSYS